MSEQPSPFIPVASRQASGATEPWTEYLCARHVPQGLEFAVCANKVIAEIPSDWLDEDGLPLPRYRDDRGELMVPAYFQGHEVLDIADGYLLGPLEVDPNHDPVTIPRATLRDLQSAMKLLDWTVSDGLSVLSIMRDHRLEMPVGHARSDNVRHMPPGVLPNDYRQIASVWQLRDGRFAPCSFVFAKNPAWWGRTMAQLVEEIVSAMRPMHCLAPTVIRDRVIAGFVHEAPSAVDGPLRATRYDWMQDDKALEVLSLWGGEDGRYCVALAADAFDDPLRWGWLLRITMMEVVETIASEVGRPLPEVIDRFKEGWLEGLRTSQTA
jgi:hypothetical protein